MKRKPKLPTLILQYGFLALMVLFALYPIWFVILASGRATGRLYTMELAGMFLPTQWTFENYRVMLFDRPFLTWMRNSLFIATFVTFGSLIIATSAAFAFSRFRFYGREFGLILLLAIQAFPGVLSLVPVALLLTAMGLYANHWGLILAYMVGTLVFSTWLLKGYFDTIPVEIEEAAMIDGAGPIQSFVLIGLPMAKPALAVTALLAFMAAWGEFVFASVLIPAPDARRTLMVGMYGLANNINIHWGYFAAGAVMTIIPVILVYTYLQRYLIGGLTLGGVKG
jgi:arabinogalactan oligomer / maltooligosaccharide transport system permease protein